MDRYQLSEKRIRRCPDNPDIYHLPRKAVRSPGIDNPVRPRSPHDLPLAQFGSPLHENLLHTAYLLPVPRQGTWPTMLLAACPHAAREWLLAFSFATAPNCCPKKIISIRRPTRWRSISGPCTAPKWI